MVTSRQEKSQGPRAVQRSALTDNVISDERFLAENDVPRRSGNLRPLQRQLLNGIFHSAAAVKMMTDMPYHPWGSLADPKPV